jgi:uncharacterized membrane protein (UPF0127 family)
MIIVRVVAILGIGLLLSGQASQSDDLDTAFEKATLVISADKHACYAFDTYLALNSDQQRRGLMHVRHLPEFTGMLFVYRDASIHSMWMKNTFIPLDMLFIRADGTVSSVETNTVPQSLKSISSIEAVNFVLELNAGVTERLHINTDSVVYFPTGE